MRHAPRVLLLVLPLSLGGCLGKFSILPPPEPAKLPVVVDVDARRADLPPGDPTMVTLLGAEKRSSVHLIEVQGEVKPHLHARSDEAIYILEGGGEMLLDRRWIDVEEGDLIFVPVNVPHAFINRAPGKTRVLSTYTPPFVEGDRVWLEQESP